MRFGADFLAKMLNAKLEEAGYSQPVNPAAALQDKLKRQSVIQSMRELNRKQEEDSDDIKRILRDGVADDVKSAIIEARRNYEAFWKQGRLSKGSKQLVNQFKTVSTQFLKLKQALEMLEGKIDKIRAGRNEGDLEPTAIAKIEEIKTQVNKVRPAAIMLAEQLIQIRERLEQLVDEDFDRLERLRGTYERCKKYIHTRDRGKLEIQYSSMKDMAGMEEKIRLLSVLIDQMVQIAPAIREEEMGRLFMEASRHKQQGDFALAMTSLDQLFHYERNQIDGHRLRASLFQEKGNAIGWQSELRLIAGLPEAEAADFFAFAEALRSRGANEEAVAYYEKAANLDSSLRYLETLGDAAAALGRWHQAEQACQKALALFPGEKRLVHKIAQAVFEDQREDQALDALRFAIQADDRNPNTRILLGRLYRQKCAFQLAKESFARALEMEPTHPDANYWIAATLYDVGDFQTALQHARHAARLEPERVRNAVVCAKCFHALGQLSKAIQALSHHAQSEKPSMDVILLFAEICREAGDLETGMSHLQEWLAKIPWQPMLKSEYGLLLAEAGELEEAMKYLAPTGV